ncbi:hypothetical protein BXY66_0488 [Shimia isoporae]|uniref:Uncharacterized protein n=1 Tax=Shimia isoporae TaxID=647720 RepID=A0A4R1NL83_9RHOB|nr:hypothetical protein [Shimia isoporae]TCL08451.1 hypothetical protein BXY66_0488 [Shimia isoporae]
MRYLLPALLSAIPMAALFAFDAPRTLGAHPWWSQKAILYGAPIGLILAALGTRLMRPAPAIMTFGLLTVLAFATAKYGQTQFAASYAEDQFAGKLWYFGWIATSVALAATISSLFRPVLR